MANIKAKFPTKSTEVSTKSTEVSTEVSGEVSGEVSTKSPKKSTLTARDYTELVEAMEATKGKQAELIAKAKTLLLAQLDSAIAKLETIRKSAAPINSFLQLSRAEQSNAVLQISSGSLEQRLGYDRETYTSAENPTTPAQAIIYTLACFIGWDETCRACGVQVNAPTKSKAKSPKSAISVNF